MISFLADEPGFERLLEWVESLQEPVTAQLLEEHDGDDLLLPIATYDRQLHSLLTIKTRGRGNGEDSHKSGLRAWQKLAEDGGMVTAHMRRKMLANLLQPTRTKQLHEVVAAQEQWEAALLEYQTVSGVKLPGDALVVVYLHDAGKVGGGHEQIGQVF